MKKRENRKGGIVGRNGDGIKDVEKARKKQGKKEIGGIARKTEGGRKKVRRMEVSQRGKNKKKRR